MTTGGTPCGRSRPTSSTTRSRAALRQAGLGFTGGGRLRLPLCNGPDSVLPGAGRMPSVAAGEAQQQTERRGGMENGAAAPRVLQIIEVPVTQ